MGQHLPTDALLSRPALLTRLQVPSRKAVFPPGHSLGKHCFSGSSSSPATSKIVSVTTAEEGHTMNSRSGQRENKRFFPHFCTNCAHQNSFPSVSSTKSGRQLAVPEKPLWWLCGLQQDFSHRTMMKAVNEPSVLTEQEAAGRRPCHGGGGCWQACLPAQPLFLSGRVGEEASQMFLPHISQPPFQRQREYVITY